MECLFLPARGVGGERRKTALSPEQDIWDCASPLSVSLSSQLLCLPHMSTILSTCPQMMGNMKSNRKVVFYKDNKRHGYTQKGLERRWQGCGRRNTPRHNSKNPCQMTNERRYRQVSGTGQPVVVQSRARDQQGGLSLHLRQEFRLCFTKKQTIVRLGFHYITTDIRTPPRMSLPTFNSHKLKSCLGHHTNSRS